MKKTFIAALAAILSAFAFTSCDKELKPRTFEVNGVQFTMVPVKAGTFTMGFTDEQYDSTTYFVNEGLRQVTLTQDFYIGETEVTQALWQAVMGVNPIEFAHGISSYIGDEKPAVYFNSEQLEEFLKKLNELTADEGVTFTLPTEAQWEYAARGGHLARVTRFAGSNDIDSVAWYRENSDKTLQPVKQLAPNEIGAYDMTGNVAEVCADYHESLPKDDLVDPFMSKEESGNTCNIVRGGDCRSYENGSQIARRLNHCVKEYPDGEIGLRLCITLPKKDK